jgi:hypothetical protein
LAEALVHLPNSVSSILVHRYLAFDHWPFGTFLIPGWPMHDLAELNPKWEEQATRLAALE